MMELSGVHTDSDQDSEQEISNFAHDFNQHGHGDVGLDPSTSDGAALLGEMGAIEKKKKQKCSDLNTYTKWAIIARHTEEINRKNDRLYTGALEELTREFSVSKRTIQRIVSEYRAQIDAGVKVPDMSNKKKGRAPGDSKVTPEISENIKKLKAKAKGKLTVRGLAEAYQAEYGNKISYMTLYRHDRKIAGNTVTKGPRTKNSNKPSVVKSIKPMMSMPQHELAYAQMGTSSAPMMQGMAFGGPMGGVPPFMQHQQHQQQLQHHQQQLHYQQLQLQQQQQMQQMHQQMQQQAMQSMGHPSLHTMLG